MKIFKYPIRNPTDEITVEIQQGAKVLCVKEQYGGIFLWAVVEPTAPLVERRLQIRGTGHTMNGTEGDYLGTVMLLAGSLVFHIFILPEGS